MAQSTAPARAPTDQPAPHPDTLLAVADEMCEAVHLGDSRRLLWLAWVLRCEALRPARLSVRDQTQRVVQPPAR